MKNRILTVLLAAVMLVTSFSSVKAEGGFEYEVMENGNVRITGFSGPSEAIEIPAEIEGHPVTEIADNAVNCFTATEVIIPDSVESIGSMGLFNCHLVDRLTMPISAKTQPDSLHGLENLTELILTEGNGTVTDYERAWDTPWHQSVFSITSLTLPKKLKRIGSNSFPGFIRVQNVILPKNLEEIGRRAFYNWSSLQSLTLPDSVRIIEDGALGLDPGRSAGCGTILLNAYISTIGKDALAESRQYMVYAGSLAEGVCRSRLLTYDVIELELLNSPQAYEVGATDELMLKELPYDIGNYVTFESLDPEVISITRDGFLTALSPGTAVITINAVSNEIAREITVSEPDVPVIYERMAIDGYFQLDPSTDFGMNGEVSVSAEESVMNDISDMIYFPSETGQFTIYLRDTNGRGGRYVLDVIMPVLDITTSNEDFALTVESEYRLIAEAFPLDATYDGVSFTCDDPEIVRVGNDGLITALELGEANVTVSSHDGQIIKTINVKVLDNNMKVAVAALPIMKGRSFTLAISNYGTVSFYSSDESICTVNSSGVIHAVNSGECYIMATSEDQTDARKIKVRVYDAFAQGIDISEWQGYLNTSNFQQMKNYGVDFVIIRAALDNDYKDKRFETDYSGARSAGLDIGAYHYVSCVTPEEAVEQAEWMIKCIEGKQFEYPIIMDIEGSRHKELSSEDFSRVVDAYCSTIEKHGYKAMVYSYASLLRKLTAEVRAKYDVWQAHWGVTAPSVYLDAYTIWQFTSDGRVPGIRGRTDCDISFFDYPSYMKEHHLNGY